MAAECILTYLSELEKNNNRDWYHSHKCEYQEACREFENLLMDLIIKIGIFDKSITWLEPKNLTFKLVRDTRYSYDKSPYNPVFRAHIGPKGKLPVPVGYYLCIRPGNRSFLGGGLFADMFRDATQRVRDYIAMCPDELDNIIHEPLFENLFEIKGNRLMNIPRGYTLEHSCAEYLKNKSWYLEYGIPDELILNSEAFLQEAEKVYAAMKPFNDFLNKALDGYEMPVR